MEQTLTKEEASELFDLIFWAANPASAGYRIIQGWNVIADKLEAIRDAPSNPQNPNFL